MSCRCGGLIRAARKFMDIVSILFKQGLDPLEVTMALNIEAMHSANSAQKKTVNFIEELTEKIKKAIEAKDYPEYEAVFPENEDSALMSDFIYNGEYTAQATLVLLGENGKDLGIRGVKMNFRQSDATYTMASALNTQLPDVNPRLTSLQLLGSGALYGRHIRIKITGVSTNKGKDGNVYTNFATSIARVSYSEEKGGKASSRKSK